MRPALIEGFCADGILEELAGQFAIRIAWTAAVSTRGGLRGGLHGHTHIIVPYTRSILASVLGCAGVLVITGSANCFASIHAGTTTARIRRAGIAIVAIGLCRACLATGSWWEGTARWFGAASIRTGIPIRADEHRSALADPSLAGVLRSTCAAILACSTIGLLRISRADSIVPGTALREITRTSCRPTDSGSFLERIYRAAP